MSREKLLLNAKWLLVQQDYALKVHVATSKNYFAWDNLSCNQSVQKQHQQPDKQTNIQKTLTQMQANISLEIFQEMLIPEKCCDN